MKKSTTHIDDLFKEELGNYAETPPPAGWEALEERLGTAAKPPIPTRWLGYVVVASLLVVIGTTVALKQYNREHSTEIAANVTTPAASATTIQPGMAATTAAGNTATNTPYATTGNTPATSDSKATENNIATGTQSGLATGGTRRQIAIYNSSGRPVSPRIAMQHSSSTAYSVSGLLHSNPPASGQPAIEKSAESEWNASSTAKGSNRAEPNTAPAENTPEVLNAAAGNSETAVSAEPKKDTTPKAKARIAQPEPARPAKHRNGPLLEAGIKGGYETGFNNDAAKKIAVAPWLQLNISDRLAIMLQPSVKTSFLNARRVGTPQSYYDVNPDGKGTLSGSTRINIIGGGELYMTRYHYTESHDSIVKTSALSRSYMEYELPVLLKYNLGRNFSAYGGINIAYSKVVSIAEHTTTIPGINAAKDTFVITGTPAQAQPLPVRSVISYSGNSIAAYSGPQYAANQGSEVRLGYMVGFSYEYNKRWLVDALVQQGFAKAKQVGGYDINTTLSAPYIRLMLGYKLTK